MMLTATLGVGPLRRISSVAKQVQWLSLVGGRIAETAPRTELFPGLVTADDELGNWNVMTDTMASKEINHVKQLTVVSGLQYGSMSMFALSPILSVS